MNKTETDSQSRTLWLSDCHLSFFINYTGHVTYLLHKWHLKQWSFVCRLSVTCTHREN